MADVQITELPEATNVSASDLLIVKQGGIDKKATPDLLIDAFSEITTEQIDDAVQDIAVGTSPGLPSSTKAVVTTSKLKEAVRRYAGDMFYFALAPDGAANITFPSYNRGGLHFIVHGHEARTAPSFIGMAFFTLYTGGGRSIQSLFDNTNSFGSLIVGSLTTTSYTTYDQTAIDALEDNRIYMAPYNAGSDPVQITVLNTFASPRDIAFFKLAVPQNLF